YHLVTPGADRHPAWSATTRQTPRAKRLLSDRSRVPNVKMVGPKRYAPASRHQASCTNPDTMKRTTREPLAKSPPGWGCHVPFPLSLRESAGMRGKQPSHLSARRSFARTSRAFLFSITVALVVMGGRSGEFALANEARSAEADVPSHRRLSEEYGKLPLYF